MACLVGGDAPIKRKGGDKIFFFMMRLGYSC